MRLVSQSCILLLLGVFLLQIFAHHNGKANPAMAVQERDGQHNDASYQEEELGQVGEPCFFSEECGPGLCCLLVNGSRSCQMRPNETGEVCYPRTVYLSPDADEGTYEGACPCMEGFVCEVPKNESAQQSDDTTREADVFNLPLGTCKHNSTPSLPTENIDTSS
uniref:Ixodegrin B n=1 Tax=Rhipicephalus appendiculatus TaxID=34631 RepID=A0A131Z6J4_RHIAP